MTHDNSVQDLFEVRSPLDGSVVVELPVQDAGSVRDAVAGARSAQAGWVALSPSVRARNLRRLADGLRQHADDIAGRIRAETGKPEAEALTEVLVSIELLRLYAAKAPRHLRARRVNTGWLVGKSAWTEREPYGVIGAITPWTYPFILAMDCVSPALAAGNGVVIKPSELTPWTTLLIPGLCEEAGIPEGLVRVVTGDGSTGAELVSAGVDRVVFTGSTATGRKIMTAAAAAAAGPTPVTLELGGKDAALVLEDADLERTARGIVFGAFFNAGQTCISVERVYVVRAVYDDLAERVTALASTLRTGGGDDVDIGPMVSVAQRDIVEEHVRDALSRGARVLTGGRPEPAPSQVYPPTVLADVTDDMMVARVESFGPLLPLIAVADEAEAIRRANATPYGLFASVWTGDRKRGIRVARQLRAGGVSINDVLSHYGVAALPMGGVGASGFGRRRGLQALDEMSRTRTLMSDRLGLRREPWWFPYSLRTSRLVRALLELRGRGGPRGLLSALRRLLAGGG